MPPPRFASHTQSSLMKRRMPVKLKTSSTKDTEETMKGNVILKSNLIRKKRSSIKKQSRSMQMMITILKQQRDHRDTIFLHKEQTETISGLENSFICHENDLVKDVSYDLKKYSGSPAKLATKIVNKVEKFMDKSYSFEDDTNCIEKNDLENVCISSEDRTIVDIACKLQLHSSNEAESVDSHCEVKALRTDPKEKANENRCKIETLVQDENAMANYKCKRKIWPKKKVIIPRCVDLQNSKDIKRVDNSQDNLLAKNKIVNEITQKKNVPRKKASFNPVWRPPGISKVLTTEKAMSLQMTSKKSSQLVEKSTASSKNKHSSTEHTKVNNEFTRLPKSTNQSKIPMKENRDPRARIYIAKAKQRQTLQCEETRTNIGSKPLDKCENSNLILSKMKSQRSQMRLTVPTKFSKNEQHSAESSLIYKKRMMLDKMLNIIHTSRKINDNLKNDENIIHDTNLEEKDDNEIQVSSNCVTFPQENESILLMKDINLDKVDGFPRRSIDKQTKLDLSYERLDTEKDQDMKDNLKFTQIAGTQSSSSCNKQVVEIGCNTPNVVYNDVEVSCDLINFMNWNIESEDNNGNNELPLNKCKETSNKMNLTLKNYDDVKIPSDTTTDVKIDTEQIEYEKNCQISSKLSENSDDKTNTEPQESIKCFDNHDANNTSINTLLLAKSQASTICNTSCSSEEFLENDIQKEDTTTSRLEIKNLPSDVIAAFELAAKRARNLHEAIIMYREIFMSGETEERNKEMVDDFKINAPCINRENEDKMKSECNTIYNFTNRKYSDDDFGGFSSCSSCSSDSNLICEYKRIPTLSNNYFETNQEEENDILEDKRIISNLNGHPNHEEVNLLNMQLVHRVPEKYALELLQPERNNESNESVKMEETTKIVALLAIIKRNCLLSREYLFPFIYCIICTVVFCFLQFSFRCNSK